MKIRRCCYRKNEKGEAMLITTILLLVLVIIVGTTMNVSGMQWDMAYMQKNTSNTYYLAKSGVEKGVDVINKAIQAQIPTILEEARKTYLTKATDRDEVKAIANQSESSFYTDDGLKYQTDEKKIIIDKESLSNFIEKEICNFLKKSFFDNTSSKIVYEVKGDGQAEEGLTTLIDIAFIIKPEVDEEVIDLENFVIRCEAQVGGESNPKDTKVVEATLNIDIPNEISNEIHEAYNWLYNPAEIVDTAVTCFSDVVVTDGASLIVEGDMRVKGTGKETTIKETGEEVLLAVPDMDELGGIIVSNEGRLEVKSPIRSSSTITSVGQRRLYSDRGNVVISNKRSLLAPNTLADGEDINTSNTGNIFCINNVATTNGWDLGPGSTSNTDTTNYGRTTEISVEGDIVANTLAIYDDFYSGGYHQTPTDDSRVVSNNSIDVKGNVFADNDVRIDEYVKDSEISVEGSIFGVSDGTLGKEFKLKVKKEYVDEIVEIDSRDPNASSGIFNRGSNSRIEADGMFVNGQPFIDFGKGLPYALWESIGEPFQDVRVFYDLAGRVWEGTNIYLTSEVFNPAPGTGRTSSIKKGNISIGDPKKTYVPLTDSPTTSKLQTYISAKSPDYPSGAIWLPPTGSLLDAADKAKDFFYEGKSDKFITDLTKKDNDYEKAGYLFDRLNDDDDDYYDADDYYSAGEGEVLNKADYLKKIKALGQKKEMYFKNYSPYKFNEHNYKGLRAYMTAKRSVFYSFFNLDGDRADQLNETYNDKKFELGQLSFDQAIDLDELKSNSWTYETPIKVFDEEIAHTVNIDDYYIDGEEGSKPYPTIIINKSSGLLTIKGGDGNKFKGLIISQGNVKIEGKITLEGSIIIGGTAPTAGGGFTARDNMMLGKGVGLSLSGDTTKVTIIHNPDMLLKMNVVDKELFRTILDALKITQFKNPPEDDEIDLADDAVELADDEANLAAILGPYNIGDIAYTQGRVKLSNQSILDITTEDIKVKIKTMKKVNE